MTRFNDTATDTLEYVAEHGTKFTWNDFKIEQTNSDSVRYEWNPSSKTYMWSGTPTFTYRLDIDKNVRDIVFVNDGTLTDTFIMDDGVHGPKNYTANMASQDFELTVYCPRKDINLIYYSLYDNIYLTINNVNYTKGKYLDFNLQYPISNGNTICQEELFNGEFTIVGYGGYYFSLNIETDTGYLVGGMLVLKVTPIFGDMTITGARFRNGEL